MIKPIDILQERYGYKKFRMQQNEIIESVISGSHSFVLMPTGGGKSLCYQIPALCRSGIGIVVSPLIALMQDQVMALEQIGINAGAINSAMSPEYINKIYKEALDGTLDLLYVAPERLVMPDFLEFLGQLNIALFAIDEAHCVSSWGHDFRPDYAALSLLIDYFPDIPRIALTATADEATRQDIIKRLGLEHGRIFISGFDRPNIRYIIEQRNNPKQQIWKFIKENHTNDSGIIYCISRKKTDAMALWLQEKGVNAIPYHAGLSAETRSKNQTYFLEEENVIIVATIAFGMGIDKPDVRFVAHMNIPKNIEAYYQETGRAGRDGLPANAYMIYGMDDAVMQRLWIDGGNASEQQKRIEHNKLNTLLGLCEAICCRRQVLLEYFGDSCNPCNNCDTCEIKPNSFDGTIAAQKAISVVYRTGESFGVAYLIDVLLGNNTERIQNFNHDKQSTYGIGVEYNKDEWKNIFSQLVTQNLLKVDIAGYGGLNITSKGLKFLQEKYKINLREYNKIIKITKSKKTNHSSYKEINDNIDKALFSALKEKRVELAKKQNVPAFVIMHDKTLIELTIQKPQTLKDLLQINGIGQAKLKRYGHDILDVIKNYINNK